MVQNHDNLNHVPIERLVTVEDLKDLQEAYFINSKQSCLDILEFQKAFLKFVEKNYKEQKKLEEENKVRLLHSPF